MRRAIATVSVSGLLTDKPSRGGYDGYGSANTHVLLAAQAG